MTSQPLEKRQSLRQRKPNQFLHQDSVFSQTPANPQMRR
jgi:hypothetical protein